jgi:pyruvate dehydrogenase E2 component (dihydrolipoamide acetyltransferase)
VHILKEAVVKKIVLGLVAISFIVIGCASSKPAEEPAAAPAPAPAAAPAADPAAAPAPAPATP